MYVEYKYQSNTLFLEQCSNDALDRWREIQNN